MKKLFKYTLALCVVLFCNTLKSNFSLNAENSWDHFSQETEQQQDTTSGSDTYNGRIDNPKSPFFKDNPNSKNDSLQFPFEDENDNIEFGSQQQSPLYLDDPKNIKTTIVYDSNTGNYILAKQIGDLNYRRPISMSAKEYKEYDAENSIRDYWMERSRREGASSGSLLIPALKKGGLIVDRVFGGSTIKITPQGSAELTFGYSTTKTENPTLPENLRKTNRFN